MVVPESESAEEADFLSAGVRTKEGMRGTGGGGVWSLGEGGGEDRGVRDVVRWCGREATGRVKGSGRDWVRAPEEVWPNAERMRFGWRWNSDLRGESCS